MYGINNADSAASNDVAVAETTLPWLQDRAKGGPWTTWGIEWRDVVLLDGQNRPVGVYHVLQNSLDDPGNRAALKAMMLAAETE